MPKHIFVTGGVASSLGKGLTASSLGRLLKLRGLRVVMQKLDPYINVDPGTMNPYEHGEVFVTDDGGETDLDLGHYERFIDEPLSRGSNATTGSIYSAVLAAERSLVTVEEVVDTLDPRPNAVVLPSWVVTRVAEVPGGARPSYAQGYYDRDNAAYRQWDPISRDREEFGKWVEAL